MYITQDGPAQWPHHHEGKGSNIILNGANAEQMRSGCGAVVCWLTE